MATAINRTTAALAAVAALFALSTTVGASERCVVSFDNGASIDLPVARTLAQQAKGLSGADDTTHGMLFIWEAAEPRAFWMKDTRVNLSVGFIDAQDSLFRIQDMTPGETSYHLSMAPAKAALELPKGQFDKLGLANGNRIVSLRCDALESDFAESR